MTQGAATIMVARRQIKSLGQDLSLKDSTSVTYFSHPSLQLQKFLTPPQIVPPTGRISLQHTSLKEDISYAKHKGPNLWCVAVFGKCCLFGIN